MEIEMISEKNFNMERQLTLTGRGPYDETLLEENILNEKIRDEIIGFHGLQPFKKNHTNFLDTILLKPISGELSVDTIKITNEQGD